MPPARTYAAAVFDEPVPAVAALAWALDRHGAGLADFRWDAGG